jgi:hypothetical protein
LSKKTVNKTFEIFYKLSKRVAAFIVCGAMLVANTAGALVYLQANPGQEMHRVQKYEKLFICFTSRD